MAMQSVTAIQAFQMWKTDLEEVRNTVKALAKKGLIQPLPKKALEGRKTNDLADFVKEFGIQLVDKPTVQRGGIVETATAIAGNDKHPLVAQAHQLHDLSEKFQEALKPFGRTLSPGYIRSKASVDKQKEKKAKAEKK